MRIGKGGSGTAQKLAAFIPIIGSRDLGFYPSHQVISRVGKPEGDQDGAPPRMKASDLP